MSNHCLKVRIQSTCTEFSKELEFLTVPKITNDVPDETFPRELYQIPNNIPLADPRFHVPQKIDILLASGVTLFVLSIGQIQRNHADSNIIIQKTSLGWIVAGGPEKIMTQQTASCNVTKLDVQIEKFWSIEEIDSEPSKSRDEKNCEEHYVQNTHRNLDGRYIVRLPFRCNQFESGESRTQALNRFYSLQRKLKANPDLNLEYGKVMQEYIDLEHMTLSTDTNEGYYLPHHAIMKSSSNTTKVRVVFDASAKTSTGLSLNDVLMIGPTIQNKVFEQILSFRMHRYVVTADIAKMYRQILIHPDDRKYHRVLWYHNDQICTYELNTVTFGVSASPFLAIRTIQQLAHDEAVNFPRASKLILRDLYVDDFLSGADSLDEILQIRDEVIELLSKGGFSIRQWSSNHEAALKNIDKKLFNLDCLIDENPIQKTSGVIWDSQRDEFKYKVQKIDIKTSSTKRKLLSEISKIFVPVGLIGPITLHAKILIQDCWKAKVTWDESLPQEIHTKWINLVKELPLLKNLSIRRQILIENPSQIEIHGFCDASGHGYGACIYVKSSNIKGNSLVSLMCAKSRVAPVKDVTIPRLELCAASLLKKLYIETRAQLEFPIHKIVFWSDSTIVLHWLNKAPHLLRTLESNRVADIQTLGKQIQWRHVRTDDNPADALSRGQLPTEFLRNKLWFSGPSWLVQSEPNWPSGVKIKVDHDPGQKRQICLINVEHIPQIYSRFSSYNKLIKVITRILRWRTKSKRGSPLTVVEEQEAEKRLLHAIQNERFPIEMKRLSAPSDKSADSCNVPFRKTTRFDNLHPFIDESGLLRVGGRLKNSNLSYSQRHPILLPSNHHVTDLIISEYHKSNLHGGIQSTLYSIRERF